MKFGSDIVGPRLDFAELNVEGVLNNVDRARAQHDEAIKSYALQNEDVLKDDTLHPEERLNRLKRLEEAVYKDINTFGGNVAQASDSILGRIIEERKDPFYNLDKQYTDVYKKAQERRASLEADGKSPFLRDASGKEISDIPTLFNPDGTMKSRQDFQFDYEGILDYNAAAEEMVNNVIANISTVAPQLADSKNSAELVKLVGDFMKYGTVESTVPNINNILKKAVEPFMQTPEYDQMKRRGVEGSVNAILQRAGEERKYTKDSITHKLLNDVLGRPAGSGSTDPYVEVSPLNAIEVQIVGTEEEAQVTNKALDKLNNKTSSFWKNLAKGSPNSLYSDVKFSVSGRTLVAPVTQMGGKPLEIPLTGSRANTVLTTLNNSIPQLEAELKDMLIADGKDGRLTTANLSSLVSNAGRERILSNEHLTKANSLIQAYQGAKFLQEDISNNIKTLEETEKSFLKEYGIIANDLIEKGFATDTQEAMLFVENYNLNKSLKSRKMYSTKSIGEGDPTNAALIDAFEGLARTSGVKVIHIPKDNSGSVKLDEDEKIKVMAPDGKEVDGSEFNMQGSSDLIGKSSKIYIDPKLKTIILDGQYAIDPTDFKNYNTVLSPTINLMSTLETLDDLSDASVKNPKVLLGEKGAQPLPIQINGSIYHIPVGALAFPSIDETSDGADIVVNIIDPKNPNRVMKFKHSDIIDAANKAGVAQIIKHLVPNSIYGAQYNNLEKATRVVQEFN